MKILILGNGFDLAHGLPTKYEHFLDMLKLASKIHPDGTIGPHGYVEKEKEQYDKFCNLVSKEQQNEFAKISRSSFWVKHFNAVRSIIGDKWLNFEEEIQRVVEELAIDKERLRSGSVARVSNRDLSEYLGERKFWERKHTYKELFELLYEDLKKVDRALAIYMDGYINRLPIEKKSFFASNEYDRLLSFNYTVTYTENYNPRIETCYIHGKADANRSKQENNIVLGYDDHYFDDVENVPDLIPFEKYYQRIVNGTDNVYYNWLDEIKQSGDKVIVSIYGHSLAPADGDVIKDFVVCPQVYTFVYYRDEYDRAEKIKNLAIILGPQEIIKLAGGPSPKIMFIQASERMSG